MRESLDGEEDVKSDDEGSHVAFASAVVPSTNAPKSGGQRNYDEKVARREAVSKATDSKFHRPAGACGFIDKNRMPEKSCRGERQSTILQIMIYEP